VDTGDTAWLLVSAALVLFMTPGLALFYGGMDRSRNVLNMLMMNFWCLLVVPIVWVVVGYSLAQTPFEASFIGTFDEDSASRRTAAPRSPSSRSSACSRSSRRR
jgi:ammonium transporter, Amt family